MCWQKLVPFFGICAKSLAASNRFIAWFVVLPLVQRWFGRDFLTVITELSERLLSFVSLQRKLNLIPKLFNDFFLALKSLSHGAFSKQIFYFVFFEFFSTTNEKLFNDFNTKPHSSTLFLVLTSVVAAAVADLYNVVKSRGQSDVLYKCSPSDRFLRDRNFVKSLAGGIASVEAQ